MMCMERDIQLFTEVSHITQLGDAIRSPAGDVDVSAWMLISKEDGTSPVGDLLASLNFGICDTTLMDRACRVP
jgi:hypothetical protein